MSDGNVASTVNTTRDDYAEPPETTLSLRERPERDLVRLAMKALIVVLIGIAAYYFVGAGITILWFLLVLLSGGAA